MGIDRGLSFRMMLLEYGPIPPSGGPIRERFLDHHGRESLRDSSDAYAEVLSLLGDRADLMPTLPFPLTEKDDLARRRIQRQKSAEWMDYANRLDRSIIEAIEPHIKRAVSAAVAALNYLEDHPLREDAHRAIHRAAFVKRGLFGCPIVLRDDEFWTDCPINLSHLRMGVSVGVVSDFECSICGCLVEDCDHQMGRVYPKTARRDADDKCTLCAAVNCEHSVGEMYMSEARANARDVRLGEASLVARPRYPQARIVEMTKDVSMAGDDELVRHAAKHMSLNCDADLGPCDGFNDMREWDLSNSPRSDR